MGRKVTIEIGESDGRLPTRKGIDQHIDCLKELEDGKPMTPYRNGSLFESRMLWMAIRKKLFPGDEPQETVVFSCRACATCEYNDSDTHIEHCGVCLREPGAPGWEAPDE